MKLAGIFGQNQWTAKLMAPLMFSFLASSAIVNAQEPAKNVATKATTPQNTVKIKEDINNLCWLQSGQTEAASKILSEMKEGQHVLTISTNRDNLREAVGKAVEYRNAIMNSNLYKSRKQPTFVILVAPTQEQDISLSLHSRGEQVPFQIERPNGEIKGTFKMTTQEYEAMMDQELASNGSTPMDNVAGYITVWSEETAALPNESNGLYAKIAPKEQ